MSFQNELTTWVRKTSLPVPTQLMCSDSISWRHCALVDGLSLCGEMRISGHGKLSLPNKTILSYTSVDARGFPLYSLSVLRTPISYRNFETCAEDELQCGFRWRVNNQYRSLGRNRSMYYPCAFPDNRQGASSSSSMTQGEIGPRFAFILLEPTMLVDLTLSIYCFSARGYCRKSSYCSVDAETKELVECTIKRYQLQRSAESLSESR